jgi:hypothetical protein
MERKHFSEEETQAAFLADSKHPGSFRAIHAAFKRQMRYYRDANRANMTMKGLRDTYDLVSYFVAANSTLSTAPQAWSGSPSDFRYLHPESMSYRSDPLFQWHGSELRLYLAHHE